MKRLLRRIFGKKVKKSENPQLYELSEEVEQEFGLDPKLRLKNVNIPNTLFGRVFINPDML